MKNAVYDTLVLQCYLLDEQNETRDQLVWWNATVLAETANTSQDIQDALMTQEEVTVVDPATLSTREFVIYQYGISILQFLRFHIDVSF